MRRDRKRREAPVEKWTLSHRIATLLNYRCDRYEAGRRISANEG